MNIKKSLAISGIVLVVVAMTFLAFGWIRPMLFWFIAAIVAIFAWFVLPKLR